MAGMDTVYCLALREVAIILACEKLISIPSYDAFDIAVSQLANASYVAEHETQLPYPLLTL